MSERPPDNIPSITRFHKTAHTAFIHSSTHSVGAAGYSLYSIYKLQHERNISRVQKNSSAWKRVYDLIIYRPLHGPSNRSGTLLFEQNRCIYCTALYIERSNPPKNVLHKRRRGLDDRNSVVGLYTVYTPMGENSWGVFRCNLSPIMYMKRQQPGIYYKSDPLMLMRFALLYPCTHTRPSQTDWLPLIVGRLCAALHVYYNIH